MLDKLSAAIDGDVRVKMMLTAYDNLKNRILSFLTADIVSILAKERQNAESAHSLIKMIGYRITSLFL